MYYLIYWREIENYRLLIKHMETIPNLKQGYIQTFQEVFYEALGQGEKKNYNYF